MTLAFTDLRNIWMVVSATEIKNTEKGEGLRMRHTELLIEHLYDYWNLMIYDFQTKNNCRLDVWMWNH